jgi:hypothetical protein
VKWAAPNAAGASGFAAWAILHALVVVGFLATVASYYQSPFGFTAFLAMPAPNPDDYELPVVRTIPHLREPTGGGYDGQFYVQLAVEPLLRDAAIDRAMDVAPYRARRILFSWTAYALGLGRPAWILEAYALQNVVAWLVLAWLLLRWFPIGSARACVLWSGCLLTHGLLNSTRLALLDGPSAVVLAVAVIAIERSQPWMASIVLGVAGLARETNLLGVTLFVPLLRWTPRSWLRVGGCTLVAILPLALWTDYLRSIYLSHAFATEGHITMPLSGFLWKVSMMARQTRAGGLNTFTVFNLCSMTAFLTQTAYVVWVAITRRDEPSAWLPIALSFAALALVSHYVVWQGSPGAITRITLPLAIGFNVLARRAPWSIVAVGNLGVIPGVLSFVGRM